MDYSHYIVERRSEIEALYEFLTKNKYPVKLTLGIDGIETNGLVSFEIYESHPLWPRVSEYITYYEKQNIHMTNFINICYTEAEIRIAKWSWIGYVHEQGYALPKYTFGKGSYKIECEKCNIHEQTQPFQIADEVKWGRKKFRRLISMAEIFSSPEVIRTFRDQGFSGFEDWDVLKYKTKQPLESIKQLYFTQTCPFPVENINDLKALVCPVCGRIRYAPYLRGTFKYKSSDMDMVNTDFMLMQEWTGNGGGSWHEVLVSNRVVQYILDQKWQGITFKAIELV